MYGDKAVGGTLIGRGGDQRWLHNCPPAAHSLVVYVVAWVCYMRPIRRRIVAMPFPIFSKIYDLARAISLQCASSKGNIVGWSFPNLNSLNAADPTWKHGSNQNHTRNRISTTCWYCMRVRPVPIWWILKSPTTRIKDVTSDILASHYQATFNHLAFN